MIFISPNNFLHLFLILSYLLFHLNLLSQQLIFQLFFYRVLLNIMKNLSNMKQ